MKNLVAFLIGWFSHKVGAPAKAGVNWKRPDPGLRRNDGKYQTTRLETLPMETLRKNFEQMSEIELLQTHGAVLDELLRRGVVKTRNNPIGDYTEWLLCNRLGLEMQTNSQKSFDAIDANGIRYQIKGRISERTSVQFSSIRNLDGQGFDIVIAVAFNNDYSIRFAVMIPHQVVRKFARYQEHTNARNLILTDKIGEQPGVTNIVHLLNEAGETL